MERTASGIPGFDELIEGGLPSGSSVLVSGGPGTGKTIFAMQYIYAGAKEHNEPGLFVTLENNVQNIKWNMENFNWDIKPLQDNNMMKIYKLNLTQVDTADRLTAMVDKELTIIADMVKEMGIQRLAIDSTTALGVWGSREDLLRRLLYQFTNALKELGCTTLLTSETRGEKNVYSAFGVEEFLADGVVMLYFSPPNRSIFIRKMRGTKHAETVRALEIGPNGVVVKTRDEIMWEAIK